MADSLRLLTFNTQLRSYAMEAGAGLDPLADETAEARARVIASRILASPFDYDIIGLMEVFDENAREIFGSRLRTKYPYAVLKADLNSLSVQVLSAATVLSTSVVLAAYGLARLVNTTFEDSGLMLFSRFPFDTGTDGEPVVAYWPYTVSAGGDAYAAKGALLARVLLDQTYNPCDVVISHMQASTDSDEEYRSERSTQFLEARNLIDATVGSQWPDDREIYMMGDLNVSGAYRPSGEEHQPGAAGGEWTSLFNAASGFFTARLYDLWVHEQSPGLAFATPGALPGEIDFPYGGEWDLGLTTAAGQRLDYILGRPRGGDRLVAQHLQIAFELMRNDPAIDGETISFTSDHYPVRADFGRDLAYCRAPTAVVVPSNQVDWNHEGTLRPGSMKWHRFDAAGAYAFRIHTDPGAASANFEVYLATNLSQPYWQYRAESDRFGLKYVLPAAPFFVRVFADSRLGRASYTLYAHRYTGASRTEAITLPPRVAFAHKTTNAGPLNSDDPATPWDDTDCVWFSIDSDVADAGGEQTMVFRLRHGYEVAIFSLVLLVEEPGGALRERDVAPAQVGETWIAWKAAERQKFYVLARRADPRFPAGSPQSFVADQFTVEWSSNMSYIFGLQGGRPGRELMLLCSDETDGVLGSEAGADDIRARLTADGTLVSSISRDELGEFNQGTPCSLEPWIAVIRYIDSVKVDLIEVDALTDHDTASVTIPGFAMAERAASFNKESRDADGTVHGYFLIDFGDGKYRFYCSVTSFLPL